MRFTRQSIADKLSSPPEKPDVIYWDDEFPGFGLRIRGGNPSWVVQSRVNGNSQRHTIGDVRRIALDAARAAAKKHFAEIALGKDPAAEKRQKRAQTAQTMGAIADQYLADRKPVLRPNSYTAASRFLERYFDALRKRPINLITRRDVAIALRDIVTHHGKVSAARARSALSAFFVWCIREGICEQNPVTGTNDPDEGKQARDRVLDADELRVIWNACGDDDFGRIVKLLILTGCRRDEIGGLTWSEIDFDKAMLNIPGSRTKNKHPLNLPLSPAAIQILRRCLHRGDSVHVFGRSFNAWSYATAALRVRIAEAGGTAPWRLHDLRRTLNTIMNDEFEIEPWIVEAILNHRTFKKGVQGVYNKANYQRQMRIALDRWAEHLRAIVEVTYKM
jgi:integrase